jgi:hypothetical protein
MGAVEPFLRLAHVLHCSVKFGGDVVVGHSVLLAGIRMGC